MAAPTSTGEDHRPGPTDLDWGVMRGVAGFRWLAWAWSVAVLVVTRHDLGRPAVAVALTGLTLAVTVATTEAAIRRRVPLFHPAAVVAEVLVGAGLLAADGWVYDGAHGQTLGSAWPVAGVLAAGVLAGPVGGAGAGVVLGLGRAFGAAIASFDEASTLGLVSSGVLYTMAGGAAGAVMGRVREAETAVARARAREEVARTLHDGVLQTLAVVQRRSVDPDLVALARDQELDLRAFLAGDREPVDGVSAGAGADLGAALRTVAARVERRDGLRVEVLLVDDDHPAVGEPVVDALAGAVGEALTNAAKHGAAERATVFVDVDADRHEVFCSVKDDGRGFDPDTVVEGMGTTASIRGRLADVGGRVEIDARPGRGVEVRLRAPLRPPRPRRAT